VEPGGRLAYGALYESLRQANANEKALVECRTNAGKNHIEAACYLFAVGNAESPETVEGCSRGRIPEARCILQLRYAPGLAGESR
jgi:hypothetical protein